MSIKTPKVHLTFRNVSMLAPMQKKVFTDEISLSRYIYVCVYMRREPPK